MSITSSLPAALYSASPAASIAASPAEPPAEPDTIPRTAAAVVDGAIGVLVDALVDLDRMIAAFMAVRTVAINEIHVLALAATPAGSASFGAASPSTASRGWSAQVTARRVAATEVCAALRISEREAEQLVAESRALVHELPSTLDALRAGLISYRHASILVDEAFSIPEESRQAFESVALPEAESRTAAGFRQRARALREREHPESLTERRIRAEDSRSVRLEPGRDGMAWLSAHLPAEQAIGAYRRLTDIAAGLAAPDEPRTLAQRCADVLADLLIDGVMPDTGLGRGIRATVLVTVPVLTLLEPPSDCTRGGGSIGGASRDESSSLEGHGPISDEVARRLAAHAPSFVRLLTHPETGTVLSVGRDRYAVPRDLRLWLRIRDETCRFPGCGRSAASSDIDHTVDWQHQGATRHDNLAHLCESHHQLKHHTDWRLSQVGGGTLEWRAPSGKRYRTEPALRLTGEAPTPVNLSP